MVAIAHSKKMNGFEVLNYQRAHKMYKIGMATINHPNKNWGRNIGCYYREREVWVKFIHTATLLYNTGRLRDKTIQVKLIIHP